MRPGVSQHNRARNAARARRPLAVTALAVHGVMTGVQDRVHGARLNAFDLVTPDGQPVRWALNLLHHTHLADRVYGPELMLRVLASCAREDVPVYLYGSTTQTLDRLVDKLRENAARYDPVEDRPARRGDDDARRVRGRPAVGRRAGAGCC